MSSTRFLAIFLRLYFNKNLSLGASNSSKVFNALLAEATLQGTKVLALVISFIMNKLANPDTPAKIGFPSAAYSNNLEGNTYSNAAQSSKCKNNISDFL